MGLHEASALHSLLNRDCEQINKPLKLRIGVSSFESACRMVIRLVPLFDACVLRSMQI